MLPDSNPDPQVSDAQREQVAALLRSRCGAGALTLDEFSDRVRDVYAAHTTADLERLTRDLPAPTAEAAARSRSRRAAGWTVAFLGGTSQRGRWRVKERTTAVSFMGGCMLDLRQAEVVGDSVVITAVAFMGGVHVVVPHGVEVVMSVVPFMGGRSCRVKPVPTLPGSPVVHVRGLAFMGAVSVQSRGPRREDERRVAEATGEPRGIGTVTASVTDQWAALAPRVAPDGTVTILFSDIQGYSAMVERLGDTRSQHILQAHNQIVRRQVRSHDGFEVKAQGDGFMLAFSSAARALRCAVALQRDLDDYSRQHPDEPLRVRMGLHTGEATRDADDFLGRTVILASRIASSATGGQILVSSLLHELCNSSGEFRFDGGHELELKGLAGRHQVFDVCWQQTPAG